jgi:hypothetical protein
MAIVPKVSPHCTCRLFAGVPDGQAKTEGAALGESSANRYRYMKAIEIDLGRYGSTWIAIIAE